MEKLRDDEKERFLGLPFLYVEARHRLGLIDDDLMGRFVAARRRFHGALADFAPGAVEFYDAAAYNAAADLRDNILFGRIAYGRAGAEDTVNKAITDVLDTMGLRDTVVEIGLDYHVGVGGKRLSSVQRQKLGIARALLKNPDILIVDEAVAVMDGATQQRLLDNILHHRDGRGVIWTLQRPSMARNFQHLVVMQSGRLIEQGSFAELSQEGTAFSELMSAE